MYDYISGTVADKGAGTVTIDAGGVGYLIYTNSYSQNRLNETGKLYTYMVVKEDEQSLYGFYTREEREMFVRLIGISGVGPKAALSVMSAMPIDDLSVAIITGDDKAFCRAPGIGAKTAQRIILELKGKVDVPVGSGAEAIAPDGVDAASEAVAALMSLGYDRSEAVTAVAQVRAQATTTEDMIRLALTRRGG